MKYRRLILLILVLGLSMGFLWGQDRGFVDQFRMAFGSSEEELPCRNITHDAMGELPRDEEEVRYFYEVLMPGKLGSPAPVDNVRGISRWENEDCVIPVFFEQGWGSEGGDFVKEQIVEAMPELTGGLYEAVFLNENEELMEKYGDSHIAIDFEGGPNGGVDYQFDVVGQWKDLEVYAGHKIDIGMIHLPEVWLRDASLIHERTLWQELGHSLGYGHSWQMDSWMSQEEIGRWHKGPQRWEKRLLNIFYRIPIGTLPDEIWQMGEADVLDSPAEILEVRESSADSEFWASDVERTVFRPGEVMHLIGRRFTSARDCNYGFEWDPLKGEHSPTVFIGDEALRIDLPMMMPFEGGEVPRPAMCISLPVKIPENISLGSKQVRVFVRDKMSKGVMVEIVK